MRSTPAAFIRSNSSLRLKAVGGAQLHPGLPAQPPVGGQGPAPGPSPSGSRPAVTMEKRRALPPHPGGRPPGSHLPPGRGIPPPGCGSGRTGRKICSPPHWPLRPLTMVHRSARLPHRADRIRSAPGTAPPAPPPPGRASLPAAQPPARNNFFCQTVHRNSLHIVNLILFAVYFFSPHCQL